MKLNNIVIDFDVEKYLISRKIIYHMVGRNAMLCCPFHSEENASFGLHVDTGAFKCLAGSCGVRGNIANFIQKTECLPTYEDAVTWLIVRYGKNVDVVNVPLELDFGENRSKRSLNYIAEETLKTLDFRHPYLGGRGIEDLWQSRFRVGFDRNKFAISMPWFDRHDRCVGIKYRSVLDKHFWWTNPNEDLGLGANKITLFGINHVFRRKEKSIVIVESEIDAIYCWQNGFPTVALGTSHITAEQLQELKNTYVTTIIIATDNDAAGEKIGAELREKINWITDIRQVNWLYYRDSKDVNDLQPGELQHLINEANFAIAI